MASSTSTSTSTSTTKPIYFWREYEEPYGFLSQWYHAPFCNPAQPEIIFTSAEQYMMYRKALLFSDSASATKILATSEPRKQQGIGRKVTGFDDKVWEENRERIVEEGNWWKFTCPVTNNNVSNNNNNANDGNNNSNSNSSNDNKGTKKDDTGLKERLLEETGNRELVEASPRDRIWGVGFGAVNAGSRRQEWGLNLLGKAIMRVRERIRKEEEEEEERGNGRAQGGGEGGGLSVE